MHQVLLFFIAESVSTLNIGSGDKTGKSGGVIGTRNHFPPPLQILSLEKPSSTELPKEQLPTGNYQGWVVWPSSQAAGGNVYLLVSDDCATKWLENCPSREAATQIPAG